jgi:hypothetical protein
LVLKNNSAAPKLIANRYGIKEEDAVLWFKELEYAYQPEMDAAALNNILLALHKFKIIDSIPSLTEICYEKNVELI